MWDFRICKNLALNSQLQQILIMTSYLHHMYFICDFYLLNNFKLNLQYVRIYKNALNLHQICTMWLDGICYPAPVAKLKRIYKFAYVQIWSKVCDFRLGNKFAHTFAHMRSRFFVPCVSGIKWKTHFLTDSAFSTLCPHKVENAESH